MKADRKYYIKPFGFLPKEQGYSLSKKNEAIKINENFYTCLELIYSEEKKINRSFFKVKNFYKNFEKDKHIFFLLDKILKKKKNILNNKKFFKKEKESLIFSILNITPDSFSDGGDNLITLENYKKSAQMIKDGADFIDVGGESTRPGATKVNPTDEALRILPTLQLLEHKKINVSLDTRNSTTMELGISSGVKIINDVSALKNDKRSVEIVSKHKIPVILMHMPGTPKNMMKKNKYADVTLDVYDYLEERIKFCESKGIQKENIIIDPGIGFGKDFYQNISLLKNLSIFHGLGCPIMLGVSRKRFISVIDKNSDPKKRIGGTLSSTINALMHGIQIHRVHDVKETNQAIEVFKKLNEK